MPLLLNVELKFLRKIEGEAVKSLLRGNTVLNNQFYMLSLSICKVLLVEGFDQQDRF